MKTSPRIERISSMEARYDEAARMLNALEKALDEYDAFRHELAALRNYMDSGQWQKDFEADEAGKIPAGVKRGVLSEDGLYNLLQEADDIIARAREILGSTCLY